MKTISNILESNRKIVTQAQRSAQTSATILQYLDIIAEKLGEIAISTNKTIAIEIEKPNVALAVKYSRPTDLNVIGAQTENGNLSINFKDTENGTVVASAKIPQDTFKNKSQIVYSFLFRNDILFQTEKQLVALQKGDQLNDQLSSKILAVSVGKEKIENLTSRVLFIFKKTVKISSKKSQTVKNICTFWNPNMRKFWLYKFVKKYATLFL